jgi:hypothetical protein
MSFPSLLSLLSAFVALNRARDSKLGSYPFKLSRRDAENSPPESLLSADAVPAKAFAKPLRGDFGIDAFAHSPRQFCRLDGTFPRENLGGCLKGDIWLFGCNCVCGRQLSKSRTAPISEIGFC